MNRNLAITIDRATRLLFLFIPWFYFWAYRKYKHSSDARLFELLKPLTKPGSVVLDVGAHIGSSTIALTGLTGPEGKVFAFEPNPENFERLRMNTIQFPQIEVYPYAVGDRSGTVNLFISQNLNVDHRMYATSNEHRKTVSVKQVALDEMFLDYSNVIGAGRGLLLRHKQHGYISLVKIDVQGYEYQVLLGMKRLLEAYRPVLVMELWPWGLKQAGVSAELVLKFFEEHDYDVSLINEKQKKPTP